MSNRGFKVEDVSHKGVLGKQAFLCLPLGGGGGPSVRESDMNLVFQCGDPGRVKHALGIG